MKLELQRVVCFLMLLLMFMNTFFFVRSLCCLFYSSVSYFLFQMNKSDVAGTQIENRHTLVSDIEPHLSIKNRVQFFNYSLNNQSIMSNIKD
eukprot:m.18142 g.18142  ORF g.18142 m.18142 type:complete len:92 (-) comp8255_c0_seq1:157-432(-)